MIIGMPIIEWAGSIGDSLESFFTRRAQTAKSFWAIGASTIIMNHAGQDKGGHSMDKGE